MLIQENKIDSILKKAELRTTHQRRQVLKVLLENPSTPLSIDNLIDYLQDGFDRVTAYRIINSFAEKGLVEKSHHLSNTLKVVLAPSLQKKHQHIIVCRLCGFTFKANICLQPGWRKELASFGFSKISHNLSFSGICTTH